MARGVKTGGGSREGSPNKRTVARERAVAAAAEKIADALGPNAFEGDAHALLAAIYKDPSRPIELRLDAARAAIAYERPRLAVMNANIRGGMTLSLEELVLGSFERDEGPLSEAAE